MAPQTRTQRQAAAKKAAATRKRGTAKESAQRTKASARRTTRSAHSSRRAARATAKGAARTTTRGAAAEATRLHGVARQAERFVLVPVGAVLEARDAIAQTLATYTNGDSARRQLNRFERRGERALRRNRHLVADQVTEAGRGVEDRATDLQSGTEELVERVRSLV
jgi:hypothetical protein